ncbi:general stress protein [Saccharophagus sp. K07]|uniref:pyridoxamine 5'-phosphate oxidase family protein n=1 Tax=Saccharophagus sp. K07 TaxID=2283636 RepID=UPI001651CB4B|nr:pyridoxamine 5'-phosphate oxidase family protein [Saccharophagus sp. K07]MBC6904813.1 general stress protein [Saccharophagus sp. K07]
MATFKRSDLDNQHDDLQGKDALDKVREIAEKNRVCFFVTHALDKNSSGARPMTVADVDDQGSLWFISAIDTHKDQEVQQDSDVSLYFQAPDQADFLELRGRAFVSQDKARIQQLWEPRMNAWFDGGKDDPRVSVIKVVPDEGYYWDTYKGGFASGVRMLVGTFLLQETHPDSAEGQLRI